MTKHHEVTEQAHDAIQTTKNRTSNRPTRPTKPKALEIALADSPELLKLVDALRDDGECPLTYASIADRTSMKSVRDEIFRQLVEAHRKGDLTSLRLFHHHDTEWESDGADGHIRLNKIAKYAARIKRKSPNSISLMSVAPAPAASGEPAWKYSVVVSTLELICAHDLDRHGARALQRGSTTETMGYPALPTTEVTELDENSVRGIVDDFFATPARWVGEWVKIARDQKHPSWKNDAAARRLGAFAVRVLTPMKKAFFSAGKGDVILRVALTGPQARALAAKKKADALSRDRVDRLLWEDALTHRRVKPPFVEK